MSSASSKPPHRIHTEALNRLLTISIRIDGQQIPIVRTRKAVILAETNYPLRYYVPRDAVQSPFQLLSSSAPETYCPYKGFASYYDALLPASSQSPAHHERKLEALFWSYTDQDLFRKSDAHPITGLLCLNAPSNDCSVEVDGEQVTIEKVKELSIQVLQAHPSQESSPYQPRPTDEERSAQRTSSRRPAPARSSSMQRGNSSGPMPPASFAPGRPLGVDLEPDSANPMVADLLYRMDDEARQEAHPEAPLPPPRPEAEAGLDSHLAWFRDRPWYRRPSDKWLRPFAFAIAVAAAMGMGPKLELLNMLVCEQVLGEDNVTDVIPPMHNQPINSSSLSFFADPALDLVPFQSWPSTDYASAVDSYSQAALFTSLADWHAPLQIAEQPNVPSNSTGIPVPKRPSKKCYQSPQVQSALASLQLRMTLSMGILAALTTGFWSNLSSRVGRLPVLRLAMTGIIFTDLVTITVAIVPRAKLPFGVNFLLVGSTIEGLLGGYSTAIAVHQSYISDATPSGTRAHIFAHFMGIVYGGIAVGPTLGGLMVKRTNNILSPFYFALGVHLLYALFVGFVIPESTNEDNRREAKADYEASRREMKRKAEARKTAELQPLLRSSNWEGPHRSFGKRLWKHTKVAFMNSILYAPLEPLSFLLPKKIQVEEEEDGAHAGSSSPSRSGLAAPEASASHISVSRTPPQMRYDCNLFFLSLTYFVESAVMGIMPYKMQYAQELFLWGSAELGMFLTFAGVTRVLALAVLLPFVIKLLHRPVKALRLPQDGEVFDEGSSDGRRRSLLDPEGRIVKDGVPSYGATDNGAPVSPSSSYARSTEEDGDEEGDEDGEWDEHQKSVEELWTLRAKHLRLIHDSKFDVSFHRPFLLDLSWRPFNINFCVHS